MASGSLPLNTYHRAQSLGAGTYGTVITVYNDDGEEFALKLFLDDDDEEEEAEEGMALGALREISILRVLRGQNAHPNIIEMADVQTGFEEEGAGTQGHLAIAMPLFPEGSVADALSKHRINSKHEKVAVAHGILTAVAFLHENSIIHRDVKADNILLHQNEEQEHMSPVLIDFSLAKVLDPAAVIPGFSPTNTAEETEPTHTPSIGTPTYRAPEVIYGLPYSLPSDLWSVGVVLLEILRGKCLEAEKDKEALRIVQESLDNLPDQPFANLIRGLLEEDPEKRLTAREALEAPIFGKFGFTVDPGVTFRRLDFDVALPLEDDDNDDDGEENQRPSQSNIKNKTNNKKNSKKADPVMVKRFKKIQKVCNAMGWTTNPMTAQAALQYSIPMSELCDMDDDDDQALLDCVVLAHKFFEAELSELTTLSEESKMFQNWSLEEYVDNEGTIFMMMDFFLYPRHYIPVA